MRSNDVVVGMTHDVFCFTMIQELVARSLGLPLGTYTHIVGSLHIYDRDAEKVAAYLAEDWQQTAPVMPPMPPGDPITGLSSLLVQEGRLREGGPNSNVELPEDAYWADLVRLLQIYALTPVGPLPPEHGPRIAALTDDLTCRAYGPFVTQRMDGRA
jgi:thymidylate synthase